MFLPPWLYGSMRSGHFFVKVSFCVTVIVKAKFQVCYQRSEYIWVRCSVAHIRPGGGSVVVNIDHVPDTSLSEVQKLLRIVGRPQPHLPHRDRVEYNYIVTGPEDATCITGSQ